MTLTGRDAKALCRCGHPYKDHDTGAAYGQPCRVGCPCKAYHKTPAAKPGSPSGDVRCETCGQNYYSESSGASDYHRHKELEGKHRCGVGEAGGVWLPNHTCEEVRALDARAKEQVEHIKGLAESLVTETARAEKAEAEAANLLELVKEHAEPDDDAEGTCPRCYEAVRRAALRVKP